MKKLLTILLLLSICSISFAESFDIAPEARSSITKVEIMSLTFLNFTDTAEVRIGYIDEDGEVVKSENVYFRDTEELTDFTDFMNGLKLDKAFLKTAVELKLKEKK